MLNTCCIRENADNKLYGTLGHLKARKDADPDLQIVVGRLPGPEGPRPRSASGPVTSTWSSAPTTSAGPPSCSARPASDGPIVEILDATVADDAAAFPSALPTRREVDHAAWVTIQIGCDNRCAFCIVPAVRGPEISRPFGELVAEVETLAADGVHRGHPARARTSTPTAATSRCSSAASRPR